MASLTQAIPVGQASANAQHAGDLGKTVFVDGKYYKLVKATSAITTAASRGVVTAFSSGVPTWNVALPSYPVANDVLFIPAGQVGSSGTTTVLANDYFLAQVSGPATALAADTAATLGAGTAVSLVQPLIVNSLGQVLAYTPVVSVQVPLGNIRMTQTTVATVVSAPVAVMIGGLV